MISINLISTLKGFNKNEFFKFDEFIKSQYFNKEKKVILLWECLKKYYPDFNVENLPKEEIFKKIYPDEKFVESRIRNLCSDLKLLAEKFLMQEAFMNDEQGKNLYKLGAFIEKRDYKLFVKRYNEMLSRQSVVLLDDSTIGNNLKLYGLKFAYLNAVNAKASDMEEIFKIINNETIKSFLTGYFKNCERILNKKRNFFNYGYAPKYFETAQSIIENDPDEFKNDSFLLLNYYLVMLYIHYDNKNFSKLYDFLLMNFKKINRGYATDAFVALINYCRTQSLGGVREYDYKAFELYKTMSDNKIWNKENRLRPTVYRGAVSVAGNCGEFEWAQNFINEFKDLQPKEHIESNYFLSCGRLYFDMKQYDKAIINLSKVRNIDSLYKYESDTLLMRIYYETNAAESLFSKIDAFKHWINNNETEISERYRQIFKKMIECFDALSKLRLKPDRFKLKKLKDKIIEEKELVNRNWILEKIEELNC
ncbi:MAG TPA: hypothetical protein VHP32_12175 [Ignavibacteria bacterium]|nr:hypothetical protein [Ignavibacteria bacterium]